MHAHTYIYRQTSFKMELDLERKSKKDSQRKIVKAVLNFLTSSINKTKPMHIKVK